MKGYNPVRFDRDGLSLTGYVQQGDTPLIILQHGLCGDANQPGELFPADIGFRHAVLDSRGHGKSPAGQHDQLSIAIFTDDLVEMIASFSAPVGAVGGVSMGAAIALRLAVIRPDLVPALILVRPAWVIESAPTNMLPMAMVGGMISAGYGVDDFNQSALAQMLADQAPDNLLSMRGFFNREPLTETAALLRRISADGPGVSAADLGALTMPVLILGSTEDIIHPISHAQSLEMLVPGSRLVEVPPKGQNRATHVAAVQAAIAAFMKGLV